MQNRIHSLPAWFLLLVAFMLVALLGYIDYLTGDYSLLIFYAIPIGFAAWFVGRWGAVAVAIASGLARFASDYFSYASSSVKFWNSLQDMLFLIMVGLLLAALQKLLTEEQKKR